jgi:hypothetical protein
MAGVYLDGRARRPASRARAAAVERAAGAAERAAAVREADRERVRDIVTAAHEGGASIAAVHGGVLEAARVASAAAAKPNADAAAQRDAAAHRDASCAVDARCAGVNGILRCRRTVGALCAGVERAVAEASADMRPPTRFSPRPPMLGSWRGYRGRFTGFLGIILNNV